MYHQGLEEADCPCKDVARTRAGSVPVGPACHALTSHDGSTALSQDPVIKILSDATIALYAVAPNML